MFRTQISFKVINVFRFGCILFLLKNFRGLNVLRKLPAIFYKSKLQRSKLYPNRVINFRWYAYKSSAINLYVGAYPVQTAGIGSRTGWCVRRCKQTLMSCSLLKHLYSALVATCNGIQQQLFVSNVSVIDFPLS